MDDKLYKFYDISNYRIEFIREENQFHYSEFSKYKFTIRFKDKTMGTILLQIYANEKQMYELVIALYQYNMYSYEQMSSERVWFGLDTNGVRFILEFSTIFVDYPTELEKSKFIMYQYNHYSNSIIPRLSFIMDEFQIEEFAYQAWLMLEGLTYIKDIGHSEIDDYLDFIGVNMDSINLD